jgi:hypothetical protein
VISREKEKFMSKKNRHKKSKLIKKLNAESAPTLKNSVARRKPENYYAEDYRGYKITVVEITDDDFRGSLEVEVDNDENDVTWSYMPFGKDELEEQLAICRREIDEDYELTLEIEQEAEDE